MPVTLYQLAKTEAEKQTSINKLSTSIPVFNEGGIRRVLHFPCKFLHQVTLVTCPCVVFLIGVRDRRLLLLYTSKCASRHNVVHFFAMVAMVASAQLLDVVWCSALVAVVGM